MKRAGVIHRPDAIPGLAPGVGIPRRYVLNEHFSRDLLRPLLSLQADKDGFLPSHFRTAR